LGLAGTVAFGWREKQPGKIGRGAGLETGRLVGH